MVGHGIGWQGPTALAAQCKTYSILKKTKNTQSHHVTPTTEFDLSYLDLQRIYKFGTSATLEWQPWIQLAWVKALGGYQELDGLVTALVFANAL